MVASRDVEAEIGERQREALHGQSVGRSISPFPYSCQRRRLFLRYAASQSSNATPEKSDACEACVSR